MELNNIIRPKIIISFLSILSMLAGCVAALICSPFVLASNITDVVGAGFGILIGAVLFSSGLISLSIIYKK